MAGKNGKATFYVLYLGWKECKGLWGREFVEPIIRELVIRRHEEELPKLTIECSRKEMKITQVIQKKKNKTEKLKYPPIPTKDVTYVVQALEPDSDVVACIYLGYNPQTRAAVHVHVYRCDSPDTADHFVEYLTQFIELPANKDRAMKIENELINKGQVFPRPSSRVGIAHSEAPSTRDGFYDDHDDPYYNRRDYHRSREDVTRQGGDFYDGGPYYRETYDQRSRGDQRIYDQEPMYDHNPRDMRDHRNTQPPIMMGSREQLSPIYDRRDNPRHAPPPTSPRAKELGMDPERENVYQSMTEELKAKLKGRAPTGPALLPPKDYDTIHRNFGNLIGIEERKSTNADLLETHSSEPGGRNINNLYSYNNPYGQPRTDDAYNRGPRLPGPISRASRSPDMRPGSQWNGRREPSPEDRQPMERGRSPTRGDNRYMMRAMSPPPGHELRNSYFPANDPLPNYLNPSDYRSNGQPYSRAMSPGRARGRSPSPTHSRYRLDERGGYGKPPKYTASKLGLVQGGHANESPKLGPHRGGQMKPRSDEGYLSLDRNSVDGPYERRKYPNRTSSYNYRDNDGDESPPPREIMAGDRAHPELEDTRQDLPGSGQPFLY